MAVRAFPVLYKYQIGKEKTMKGCVFMSARLSWDEIKQLYPNQWVALENRDMDAGMIVSANVVDSCQDAEIAEMRRKYRPINSDRHIWFVRTSEGNNQYYVHLLNAKTEIVGVK